jgi:hypothetical protein
MADTKYGRYIISEPIHEVLRTEGAQATGVEQKGWSGGATYPSQPQLPEAPLHAFYTWFFEVPTPNPVVLAHEHPYDELIMFMGTNPDDTTDLGAVVEFGLGDETHVIDKVSAIYIPAGLRHCPILYREVTRPHNFVAISLSPRYITEGGEGGGRYVSPDLVDTVRTALGDQ